jgi:hypothetical protein
MSSLRQLAEKLGKDTVKVREVSIDIRAVLDSEAEILDRILPVPLAPRTKRDPEAGSLAPLLPDTDDPAFIRAMQVWNRRRMRMEVAIACGIVQGLANSGVTDEQLGENLARGEQEVKSLLTAQELSRVFVRVRDLADSTDQALAREALIVDMSKVAADDIASAASLPKEYGTTLGYLDLRIAERFKIPPWAEIDPGWRTILRAHERIRQQEEAREGK